MSVGRRLAIVVAAAAALAAPAVVLRALCVGRSCAVPGVQPAAVPFCSLPDRLRAQIVDGFHEQRGPDVLAVTGTRTVAGSTGLERTDVRTPWPSATASRDGSAVPLAFYAPAFRIQRDLPSRVTLDAVAPTIAAMIELRRPHPEVRSGRAIVGFSIERPPRLVVIAVWKGAGSSDLRQAVVGAADPLRFAVRGSVGSVATLDARVGSLPLDPAAVLATIGAGGLPREHGITGTLIRNDEGRLVRAWSPDAPPSVIATLGDDLDERTRQRARIGLVGTDVTDRGVIGGTWYFENDRDDIVIGSGSRPVQLGLTRDVLARGYGDDDVTDLLAVTFTDDDAEIAIPALAGMLDEAAPSSWLLVVTATGSRAPTGATPAPDVERDVEAAIPGGAPLVEATAVGGLFLDQDALVETGLTADAAVQALRGLRGPGGNALFADAFPATSVTFARYC